MRLYLQYAISSGFKDAVVRMPDIFIVVLHYASSLKINIHLDTLTGNNCQFIDITVPTKSLGTDENVQVHWR